MALCNIGRTIIDEARLCYVADTDLRDYFSDIKEVKQEDGYYLVRTKIPFYEHCFYVHWGQWGDKSQPIAKLYFSHCVFGTPDNEMQEAEEINKDDYIFYRLENHILYSEEFEIREALKIPTLYGMEFHHFTRLDLAVDRKRNIVRTINGLMKRKDIGTVINAKWVDDHKKVLDTMKEYRDRTLDKSINPELVIMQVNAKKNKNNGIIVAAYNKMAEIKNKQSDDAGYKQYILNYYGCPKKSLHRLEVRVNASNITKYCKENEIYMSEEVLFNQSLLTNMYFAFLSRVLRFSYVSTSKSGRRDLRTTIEWIDIFCNKKL